MTDQKTDQKRSLIADKTEDRTDHQSEIRTIKSSIPMDKYLHWYYSEYVKGWRLPAADQATKPELGSAIRMGNISGLKYRFRYDTMNTVVVVFKIYDYQNQKDANYALLFCELIGDVDEKRRHVTVDTSGSLHGQVLFTFYSAAPSFISCDGEYRSRFSQYQSLITAKKLFGDIFEELEAYVLKVKVRRQWSLYTSYFYPRIEQESKNLEIEFAVRNSGMNTVLLTVSWFNAIFAEFNGLTRSHINENFRSIFLGSELEADLAFCKALVTKYGADRIETMYAKMTHSFEKTFSGVDRFLQCGIKMIPLNIKEVQDPLKLKYKPWREYFVTNKLGDLVINSVCPSFAIPLDWLYIKNSKKGLFDNKSQYDRMKNSDLAKDILHVLYEAQRGTYFASEGLHGVNKTTEQIKNAISSKFKKLSEKIDDPINFCIEEIIMSEVTLAFVTEYAGETFADTLSLVQKSKTYDLSIGIPYKDSGFDYFAKYLFEICYALYCMNSRFGIIHGDLHLNNATIGALYYPDRDTMLNADRKYQVVYNLHGDQYVFPNNCHFACLIDFSRAVLNPSMYKTLADQGLPASYNLVSQEDKFTTAEITTLLNLYTQLFPNKMKQREELVVLFKNHYEAVFKLLTCIDLYLFTLRLNKMLSETRYLVGKRCVELTSKVNKAAELYITVEMNNLIHDAAYSEKITSEDYPIAAVIKKCFGSFASLDIKGVVTDAYNYDNELKFSVSKYDLFPDIFKYVKYEKSGRLVSVDRVAEVRREERLAYEQLKLRNLEMMNYIAMRHKQKMQ